MPTCVLLTYMFGHSGKKLLFMGQDFGQEREWSEERELDWFLLGEKNNQGLHAYVKELLNIYRKYPASYELDDSWDGFEWMNADDGENSVYSFVRKSSKGTNSLLFVLNMTPVKREEYTPTISLVSLRRILILIVPDGFVFNVQKARSPWAARASRKTLTSRPW